MSTVMHCLLSVNPFTNSTFWNGKYYYYFHFLVKETEVL